MYTPQDIWQEQCAATVGILERYGQTAAFDYLVGEKLLTFTQAAETRPEFARQLPRFVATVREILPPQAIAADLQRLERRLLQKARAEARRKNPASDASTELAAFRQVVDLLKAPALGTA